MACAEMPGNLVSPAWTRRIRHAIVRQSTRGSREFPPTTREETISDERALSVDQHSVVEDCHTLLQTNIAQGAAGSVFPLDEVTHTHTHTPHGCLRSWPQALQLPTEQVYCVLHRAKIHDRIGLCSADCQRRAGSRKQCQRHRSRLNRQLLVSQLI